MLLRYKNGDKVFSKVRLTKNWFVTYAEYRLYFTKAEGERSLIVKY
jgi:hypothetical protein